MLLIIDGNALMHRAYHALPDFKAKNGIPTNAVYGFATVLHKTIQDLQPSHVVVCFDTAAPTFRDEMFEEYRSHRPDTDKELIKQFPMVRDFLKAADIDFYEKDGVEADDLIAVIAKKAEKRDLVSVILTGDKDIFQLVNDKITVLTPAIGYSKGKLYDRDGVIEKFGVPPEQIPDFKALVGDPSDNYKGVKGIGPKTAVGLIKKFGSIEEIYEHLDEIDNARTRELLEKEKEHAMLSKKLAVLLEDVDEVDVDIDATKFSHYNESLRDFFEEYQFRTLDQRFFGNGSPIHEKHDPKPTKKDPDDQLGLF